MFPPNPMYDTNAIQLHFLLWFFWYIAQWSGWICSIFCTHLYSKDIHFCYVSEFLGFQTVVILEPRGIPFHAVVHLFHWLKPFIQVGPQNTVKVEGGFIQSLYMQRYVFIRKYWCVCHNSKETEHFSYLKLKIWKLLRNWGCLKV